jgi:hypothetical protein
MTSTHEEEMIRILEQVRHSGWGFLEWWKLYLWYGVEKLRKEPYRDISSKWEKLSGNPRYDLRVSDTRNGLLLVGRPVQDIDERT